MASAMPLGMAQNVPLQSVGQAGGFASLRGDLSHDHGHSDGHGSGHGSGVDAVEAYFECISTCSLDDAECITVCTTVLRDSN
jgi:hypothetical protein